MESDYHWLVAVALVTSSVIAITANAFLLFIFARRRSLRTIPNRFVINLLITNLLSSLLLIPLLIADQESFSLHSSNATRTNETLVEERIRIKEEYFDNDPVKIFEEAKEKIVLTTVLNSSFVASEAYLCYFAQAATSFMCTASLFSILLIGVNQYFGVIHSLRYHFYVNKSRATVFILTSWLAALSCAVLSTLTYSDGGLWHFCSKNNGDERPTTKILNTVYAFTYFIFVILAPFAAICIIYVCIYSAARRNSERMRKSNNSATNNNNNTAADSIENNQERRRPDLPKVHSAPNFSVLENVREPTKSNRVKRTSSDRNNFIVNLKHKISNASVFRYREETRAAKISVLVIVMVLICYVPYGLTLILTSGYIDINPNQIFIYLSLVLLVFSNVISPFLFGYRNKRVKREIGRMLGLVPPPTLANNNLDIYKHPNNVRNRSFDGGLNVVVAVEHREPLLADGLTIPEVVVTCKVENERKSILKRVGSGWNSYKKCNFITVPDSCLGDARGSFSSASTQVSTDD